MFFNHDIAPAYWASATQEFLEGMEVQILEHPAYSPDLAPCDFGLFPYVELRMKGRRFSSDEELIAAFQEECDLIPKQMWEEWFDEWFVVWKSVLSVTESISKNFENEACTTKIMGQPCMLFSSHFYFSRFSPSLLVYNVLVY